ncbi:MAG TPA: hypothetical protein VMM36_08015 [Opitutaceae bacterium]|nr:hypothetical protein [Opitutaceae bacterium]
MPKVTLPAHFDGEQIRLDEPYKLQKDARLLVVLMAEPAEHEKWTAVSEAALVRVYGSDEPEYTIEDVRR